MLESRNAFVRPGRAIDNGCIESFNGRVRDECREARNAELLRDVPVDHPKADGRPTFIARDGADKVLRGRLLHLNWP